MDPRTRIQWIVAPLVVLVALCLNALAGPVHTYSRDFRLRIPAEPADPEEPNSRGWMEDAVIEIPDHFTISDLNVRITLTHTNVFDLQLFLESPLGTRICLNMYDFKNEFSVDPDYTNTIFDDEAPVSIKEGEAPFTGRFRPIEPYELSEFDGQDTYGIWRLQIYDVFHADTGYLGSFQLIVTLPDPLAVELCGAVNVGQTSATLCGMVDDDGGEACQCRFRYCKEGDGDSFTSWSSATKVSGESFSQDISGLTPGCKYYFWAQAKNSAGQDAGSIKCLTTLRSLLQLEAPNGGTFLAGSRCLICWKADPALSDSDVLIEYSTDDGSSWNTIDTVANGDGWRSYKGGHYSWYPPAVGSDECLVRISDSSDPSIFDMSDSTFSIVMQAVPDVVRLAQADAEPAITSAGLVVGTITYIYDNIAAAGEVMGQHPAAGTPVAVGFAVDLAISAGPFAAAPPAVASEYAVNIGRSSARLRGLITDDGGGCCQYRFWYHEEGGDHYDITPWFSEFKTAGEWFSQDISGLSPGTKYYFWAQAKNSEGQTDRWPRSRSFRTLQGLLQLEGPHGGTFSAGSRCLICWKADAAVSDVLVEYSKDNGSSWNVIDIVANRDAWRSYRGGYYSWYPPAASSDECLVRISDTDDPNIFDITDGTFTIVP